MSKQTAVDMFHDGIIDLLRNASVNTNTVAKLWMKCKAMEREQIEDAYDSGKDDGADEANGDGAYFDNKEDYYFIKYGKEPEQ